MFKIKIGLSSSSVYPLKLEETFKLAKSLGYDGVEIMVTNETATQSPEIINGFIEKYGVPVLSIHAPVLLLTHFVWGRDPELKLWKSAELARNVNASTVVVHPPFSWQNDYSKNFIKIADSITKITNIEIAIENMFPWRMKGKEVKAYAPDWSTIENEAQALTLDFSHAALSGLDSYELTQRLHQKIRHIHLCDGLTTTRSTRKMRKESATTAEPLEKDRIFDEHLVPGEGNQPIREVLTLLKEQGWDGSVVAEINTRKCKTDAQRKELLTKTLKYAQQFQQL